MTDSISILGVTKFSTGLIDALERYGDVLFSGLEEPDVDQAQLRNRHVFSDIHSLIHLLKAARALQKAIDQGETTFKSNPVIVREDFIDGSRFISFTSGSMVLELRQIADCITIDGLKHRGDFVLL